MQQSHLIFTESLWASENLNNFSKVTQLVSASYKM